MAKKHHKPAGGFNTRKALKPFLHSDYGVVQTRARKAVKAHYKPKKVKRLSHSLGRLEHAYSAGTRGAGQDITDPLTPQTLKKEVNAATRVQYGPQEHDFKQQFKENTYQQRHAQDWYGQYQQQLKGATLQQAGFNAQAQQFLGSQAGALGGMDAQVASQQQSAMQADAAKRGASVDPSVGKTAYAALLARQQGYGNFQGLNASQGQTAGGYLANQQAVGGAQAIGTLKNLLSDRKDLSQKRSDLRREEGDYKTKYRGTLRDSERSYLLERKAFGLNVQKEKDSVASDKASRKAAAKTAAAAQREKHKADRLAAHREARLTQSAKKGDPNSRAKFFAEYGHSPAWAIKHPNAAARIYAKNHPHSKSSSSSSSSSSKKFPNRATPAETRSDVVKINNAVARINRAKKVKGFKSSEFRQVLEADGVDHDIVNAAFDIAMNGALSPPNVRALHKTYHIKLKPHFRIEGKRHYRRRKATDAVGNFGSSFGNSLSN